MVMKEQELAEEKQRLLTALADFSSQINETTKPVKDLLEVQASLGNPVAKQLLFDVEHLRQTQVRADESCYQELNLTYQRERRKS